MRRTTLVQPILKTLCLTLCASLGGCFVGDDGSELDDEATDDVGDADDDVGDEPDPDDGSGDNGVPEPEDDGAGDDAGGDDGNGDDGAGDDGAGDDGAGDDGEPVDDVPPELVQAFPADGEAGVAAADAIVLTFSEPMDKAATQAAFQSTDFPSSAVTMSWNESGDTLTITPNEELDYAIGTDPAAVEALAYGYSLTTAARDQAGNELQIGLDAEFTTLKLIGTTIGADYLLSGRASNDINAIGDLWVGDGEGGQEWRGAMTFHLDDLPEDIASFYDAEVILQQIQVDGAPFELGDVRISHTTFEAVSEVPALDLDPMGTFSSDEALGERVYGVVDGIAQDYFDARPYSQYVLDLPVGTDFDGVADLVRFEGESLYAEPPMLAVAYTVP